MAFGFRTSIGLVDQACNEGHIHTVLRARDALLSHDMLPGQLGATGKVSSPLGVNQPLEAVSCSVLRHRPLERFLV